jgi:hypothetical protein
MIILDLSNLIMCFYELWFQVYSLIWSTGGLSDWLSSVRCLPFVTELSNILRPTEPLGSCESSIPLFYFSQLFSHHRYPCFHVILAMCLTWCICRSWWRGACMRSWTRCTIEVVKDSRSTYSSAMANNFQVCTIADCCLLYWWCSV